MNVIPIVGPAIDLVLKILGRKKFVLWYEGPDHKPYLLSRFVILRDGASPGPGFVKKSLPMSFRQCKKTRTALWMLGP